MEREIVRQVACGLSNAQIAELRGVKGATVRNQVHRLLEKLFLSSRLQLALWALRHGVVSIEEAWRQVEVREGLADG